MSISTIISDPKVLRETVSEKLPKQVRRNDAGKTDTMTWQNHGKARLLEFSV